MNEKPSLLERWGRFAVRRRWYVFGGSLATIVVLLVAGRLLYQGTTTTLDIPGTESQEATDVLRQSFPERAGDYGDIVFRTSASLDAPAVRAEVDRVLAEAAAVPEVVSVASPYAPGGAISTDRTAGIARVQFSKSADSVSSSSANAVKDLAASARSSTLDVEFGGPVPSAQEHEGPNESTILGLVAALVVLYILFRTLLPTLLPIGTAVAGLAAGFGVVFSMTAFADLSKFAPNISAMLGLGVGIDYALFIVARHREALLSGRSPEEAAGVAMATAGKSVAFAGGVVVTSLLGLSLMGIPFVAWLGLAAAAMVALAVAVAMTLLPALLGLAGERIAALRLPIRRNTTVNHDQDKTAWSRLGFAIMRRPWLFLTLSSVTLIVLAIPVLDMRLGSADAGNNPPSSQTRRAYDVIADEFGPGANGPLQVVLRNATPEQVGEAKDALAKATNVAAVSGPVTNAAGDTAILSVVPKSAPQDAATTDLVHELRNDVLPGALGDGTATSYVGGTTARYIDIADRISDRLPLFFALVIGLSFVLLVLVFRSLMIPLKAALMNLISIGAAYGVVVAVFQWGWGLGLVGADRTGPVESFLPMMLFAVLFGLSMDYEVFLVSRIREEYLRTGRNDVSVARGLSHTASVITAAATIMIVVFFSFTLNDQRVVKEFGLGLGVAVLVDATIVRLVLVPATMELMGHWNWWLPGWLDRMLPNISIEGSHEMATPARTEQILAATPGQN